MIVRYYLEISIFRQALHNLQFYNSTAMRVIFSAPSGTRTTFRFLDSLHGAIINAWTEADIPADSVVGWNSENWSFGAVGNATSKGFRLKSVVIGAEGNLEPVLRTLEASSLRKRSSNGDVLDLTSWRKSYEMFPVVGRPTNKCALPVVMLSPLAVSVRGRKGRWHHNVQELGSQLQEAVNHRLSRLAKRSVKLVIEPDQLYLRANPKHSTLVHTRSVGGGRKAFVIAMMFPMVIRGSIEDLRSAWCLGIGEKNRYGFGCIGHAQP